MKKSVIQLECMPTIREIPKTISFEEIDIDPFAVPKQPSRWISLPIFLCTLPLTIVSFFLFAIYSVVAMFFYRKLSYPIKNVVARHVTFLMLLCTRVYVEYIDYSGGKHSNLFIGNHISMMEGVMLIYKIGHIRFLSASYAKSIPFFGRLIQIVDPIFIDRKKGRNNYTQQITKSLSEGSIPHVIFPEGSYENAQVLLRFKSGAFVAGTPVTPVLFVYTKYVPYWNRQESSLPTQLFRYASRFYTHVKMIMLPIYVPNEEEKKSPKVYAENVRRYMSYHLKIPLSKYDVHDSPNFKKDLQ